jgi:hypothetical protein
MATLRQRGFLSANHPYLNRRVILVGVNLPKKPAKDQPLEPVVIHEDELRKGITEKRGKIKLNAFQRALDALEKSLAEP